ncbi:MAG: RNA-binding S4 domain-containing protein [Deltaproteobacteria bacterium]|nr:RNA-binding S4 domain-containing protein [Deltaproteobacteria bacterium]
MRLDQFLKTSRLVKRRTQAKEMCDKGFIRVNGHPSKPSKDIKQKDIISIYYRLKKLTVEVLDTSENVKKEDAKKLYKVLEEKKYE